MGRGFPTKFSTDFEHIEAYNAENKLWHFAEKNILDGILLLVLTNEPVKSRDHDKNFPCLRRVSKEWFSSVDRVYQNIRPPIPKTIIHQAKLHRIGRLKQSVVEIFEFTWDGYKKAKYYPYLIIDVELWNGDCLLWKESFKAAQKCNMNKLKGGIFSKHVCFCYDGSSWHVGHYAITPKDVRLCSYRSFFYVENNIQLEQYLNLITQKDVKKVEFCATTILMPWNDPVRFSKEANEELQKMWDQSLSS